MSVQVSKKFLTAFSIPCIYFSRFAYMLVDIVVNMFTAREPGSGHRLKLKVHIANSLVNINSDLALAPTYRKLRFVN